VNIKDVDILQNMNEDPTTIVPQILEQGLLQEQPFISSGNMVQTEAPVIDSMPSNINSEERALVLYNPPNIPFVKSPSSPDFTIVVNSELIPGLKGELLKSPFVVSVYDIWFLALAIQLVFVKHFKCVAMKR
jgi:hypothetical protein